MRNKKRNHRQQNETNDVQQYTLEERIRFFVHYREENHSDWAGLIFEYLMLFLPISLICVAYTVLAKLWWGLCIMIIINVAHILFLIFVPKLKKTYKSRFLSEGISSTFLALVFLSMGVIPVYSIGYGTVRLAIFTLIFCFLCSIALVAFVLWFSKTNKFRQMAEAEPNKYEIFFGSLIPVSGVIGMLSGRIIFKVFDIDNQGTALILYSISLFLYFLSSFGNGFYIKYYYCIKYKIECSENGETTSPRLDYAFSKEQRAQMKAEKKIELKSGKRRRKEKRITKIKAILSKIPRWVKIIVCIICAPFVLYLAIMIVGTTIIVIKKLVEMLL